MQLFRKQVRVTRDCDKKTGGKSPNFLDETFVHVANTDGVPIQFAINFNREKH